MTQKSRHVQKMFLLAILVSWLVGLSACSSDKVRAAAPPEIVKDVALLTAQNTITPDYTEATGTVLAAQSAQLSSQVMGAITRVNVREGDQVRRGEVLITIDAARQRSAYDNANAGLNASQQTIAATEADYALAEATMNRYQALYDKKSVSPQEYDEVKARLAASKARRDGAAARVLQAEAAVSEASTAVGFTRIRAPFDGLVIAKLADAGTVAAPGVPLLTIEDPTRFRLEAMVDESQIGVVRVGETVPVVIDSLGNQTIPGKVARIVPDGRSGESNLHRQNRSSAKFPDLAQGCLAGHASPAENANHSSSRKTRCCTGGSWMVFTWWGKTRSRVCDT